MKRFSFKDDTYHGLPVPNFGDYNGRLLIVGLAPAAHGANRTGRMFTGDRSGDWLYRALYKAAFASQSTSIAVGDGLELDDCLITAVCHCAPPGNKPIPEEIVNCSQWLLETVPRMKNRRVTLCLGGIAWAQWSRLFPSRRVKFVHGCEVELADGTLLIGSYHPSQQNTFTGKLTEPMFDAIFTRIRSFLDNAPT